MFSTDILRGMPTGHRRSLTGTCGLSKVTEGNRRTQRVDTTMDTCVGAGTRAGDPVGGRGRRAASIPGPPFSIALAVFPCPHVLWMRARLRPHGLTVRTKFPFRSHHPEP
jgi:hypothetical protein